jgi:hypothetical protein
MTNKVRPFEGNGFPEDPELNRPIPKKDNLDAIVQQNIRSKPSSSSSAFHSITAFFSNNTSNKTHVKVWDEIHSNRTSPTQSSVGDESVEYIAKNTVNDDTPWGPLTGEIKQIESTLRYLPYARALVLNPGETLSEKTKNAIDSAEYQRKDLKLHSSLEDLMLNARKTELLRPGEESSPFHQSLLELNALLELVEIEDKISKIESSLKEIPFDAPTSNSSRTIDTKAPLKDLCSSIHKQSLELDLLFEEIHSIQKVQSPKIPRMFSLKPNPRVELHNRLIQVRANLLEKKESRLEHLEQKCDLIMEPIVKGWKALIKRLDALPSGDKIAIYKKLSADEEFKKLPPFEKTICENFLISQDKGDLSEIETGDIMIITKLLSKVLS